MWTQKRESPLYIVIDNTARTVKIGRKCNLIRLTANLGSDG